MNILKENDTNGDNVLSYEEFQVLANKIIAKHNVLKVFLGRLDKVFEEYDKDHSGTLDLDEIRAFLIDAEKGCTALPAVSPFLFLFIFSCFVMPSRSRPLLTKTRSCEHIYNRRHK